MKSNIYKIQIIAFNKGEKVFPWFNDFLRIFEMAEENSSSTKNEKERPKTESEEEDGKEGKLTGILIRALDR